MPITEELNNLKKIESVGLTHEQSEALADVIEKAQVSGKWTGKFKGIYSQRTK